jgi:hypothetical protein
MNFSSPQLNLQIAWLWIVLGFGSGLLLGLFFHREKWLGGYDSLKRRMYRLGHISFFGLGVVNLCFYFTVRQLLPAGPLLLWASWGFVVGAIAMPSCCLLMAHFPRTHLLFGVPVLCLLAAGCLTLTLVTRAGQKPVPESPSLLTSH